MFGRVKIEKIDLFDEKFENNNIQIITDNKKQPVVNSANITNAINEELPFNEIFKSLEEQGLHLNRKWYLVVPDKKNYGPFTANEIYSFLNHLFIKSPAYKKINSLLICDSEFDIYFQPDAVMEVLLNEIVENKVNNNTSKLLSRERKLPDPHLITKYDVYEMNSKFQTTYQFPIKQLNGQLNDVKNKENHSIHNNNIYFNDLLENIDNNTIKGYGSTLFDISLPSRSIENYHNKNKYNKFNLNSNLHTPHLKNDIKRVDYIHNRQIVSNKNIKELKLLGIFPNVKLISIKDKLFD